MSIQLSNANMTDAATLMLEDILKNGYASVVLSPPLKGVQLNLRREVERYFSLPLEDKLVHASEDFNYGFREFGRQFSASEDRPDLNESFVYRGNDPTKIPRAETIPDFTTALEVYWSLMASLTGHVFDAIAQMYSETLEIDLQRSSYIETNWYRSKESRDLLQDRHEDGHLFTLVNADGPGLEIEIGDRMTPVDFGLVDLIVMPGSLMTMMTGGRIRPLYHQVRNYHLAKRSALLYLVNPPFDKPVLPFTGIDNSLRKDVAEAGRVSGRMFGLPDAPDT